MSFVTLTENSGIQMTRNSNARLKLLRHELYDVLILVVQKCSKYRVQPI